MSAAVAVTGAAGFVGSHLVRRLRDAGVSVRGVIRSPNDAERLQRLGCEVSIADVRDQDGLTAAFAGCRAVVHLVAVIRERPGQTFEAVNRLGTANVVAAAAIAGVSRLVHMSALGAAPDAPRYPRSKWAGEEAVRRGGVPFVIFRPSILLGSGGGAAAQFADIVRFGLWYPMLSGDRRIARRIFGTLATLVPVVPVLGDGQYKSMPVALDDVLPAISAAIDKHDVLGQTYEIGGPEVLTYDELVGRVARVLGLRRVLLHLPEPLARRLVAAFAVLPNPPITRDEAEALFVDNVCDPAPAVRAFGLRLRPVEQALREALTPSGEKP